MKKMTKWKDALELAEKMANDSNIVINYYDDSTGPDDPDALILMVSILGRDVDLDRDIERMKVLIHNDFTGRDRITYMDILEVADLLWANRKFINKYSIQEVA